ncbi:3-dehydroquinate synthase II [Frankia casuarinae]|uniref:3-dehydroquinate synthase II n=1 Tax=Frankia casuarinae (strain DSM 45818 / CECT 9043 / HFP020203 / CcI3) TaxID=106370 RepID=Q2JBA0_FRACC|nr:3-dehydroquinate synthase II family protein [Frankia casuarinae]ETA00357.1 3-dehydroquinate synthase II [Frankia sp. CcI6]OHV49305.1 3-dehydroquinate synthase [Frankia sp. CgIS1]TFE24207.1 3-dehydroquinate synthase II family protein [Frankia sp. B2]ABD11442.1 3-dehydroquinate synthase II [Frankia casuarinae]EYT89892.1 3-dehydroquinate synthase II [Frankia casuarinae]
MKLYWVEIHGAGPLLTAVAEEAIHQRVDAVVSDDPANLSTLPPTVKKVLLTKDGSLGEDLDGVDVVILDAERERIHELSATYPHVEFGRYLEVTDAQTLDAACAAAQEWAWTVLRFRDETKIPLEIVLAAAHKSQGSVITVVHDTDEANVVLGCLERGADGIMLAPKAVGELSALKAVAAGGSFSLQLEELEVIETSHVGMGERACVDTCSMFGENEGILVGSHSKGMILACSETHPLPYMPTRPFRVNAGAVHSYTMSMAGRTNYLSELQAGGRVLAVDADGRARPVTVGRIKIETRPLRMITAKSPSGRVADLIVQDDWHVRVLGPGGVVINVTELQPGTKVLGYLPVEDRHVGYPIDEFCIEK